MDIRGVAFEGGVAGGSPVVSKEAANRVAAEVMRQLSECHGESELQVRALVDWIYAVAKRLPTEAAIRRDRERRKANG